MSALTPHKAYKVIAITDTTHLEWGPGKALTVVQGGPGVPRKWKSQLPKKYLKSLAQNYLDDLLKDISKKRYPYVVYRETMLDRSFRIDLLQYSKHFYIDYSVSSLYFYFLTSTFFYSS